MEEVSGIFLGRTRMENYKHDMDANIISLYLFLLRSLLGMNGFHIDLFSILR